MSFVTSYLFELAWRGTMEYTGQLCLELRIYIYFFIHYLKIDECFYLNVSQFETNAYHYYKLKKLKELI